MTPMFERKNQCTLLAKPEINPPAFSYAAIMLCGTPFQKTSLLQSGCALAHTTSPLPYGRDSVCPLPLSLAASNGITIVFFSTQY